MKNKTKYYLFITLFTVTAIVYGQTDTDANNRGMSALKQYDYDTAVTEFTEAIRLNPDNAVYYFYRGEAYNFKEDWDKAIDDFTKAIQLNPNYSEAYASRAWAYYGFNDITNALANIDAAKQIDPDNSSANYLYGEIVPEQKDESNIVIIIFLLVLLIIIAVFICIFRSKKIKIKYHPFIAMFSFIGLIIAILVFLSFGFVIAACYTNGFQDLPFLKQILLLAAVYFLVFPAVMVLIGNVYLKASGKKTWGNWLKVPLNYNSIFTVIAIYQCAFLVIETLVLFNNIISSSKAFDTIIRVMMLTVPFIMFIFSKKILKKLFGLTEIEGVCETGDEKKIDPNNFTIRQPVYALVIYIIITVMFTGIYAIIISGYFENNFRFENLLAALIFLPLGLLGPFLIIIRHRWKIVIKDKQISYTTYLGRTKTCTFDYITKATQGIRHTRTGTLNIITAYHDKKMLFVVSDHCSGYKEFFQRLKDEGGKIIE